MKNIRMVVFDMAGTTVNEDNLVYKTVQKVINREGFNVTLQQVLHHGAGKEKYKAITDVLTACTNEIHVEAIARRAFENFKDELEKAYHENEVTSFKGIESFFDKLRANNIKIVLNTGYNRITADKLMAKLGWEVGRQVDGLVTADDVANGRPAPDMIFMAMEQFGISDAAQVLKAGDSEIDIVEGINAGCGITVGVLSGAQNRQQLQAARPDYILNNVTELDKVLFGL